jgi:nucleotide-binding universal stress UspA family protein
LPAARVRYAWTDGATAATTSSQLVVADGILTEAGGTAPVQALTGAFTALAARSGRQLTVTDVVPPKPSDTQALSSWFLILSVLIPSLAAGSASALAFRRAPRVAAEPVTLVVGFDDSEPARRALTWGADLLRSRPGELHVIYADHVIIDSTLSGFGRREMDETRDEKATSVAEGARAIAAATGTPHTFERRQEPAADAILHAAASFAAEEPGRKPLIVTGRSHHAALHVLGSVPGRLLHESPYPVVTIS